MWSKMGTTDSRSDGGPGDRQERRDERPGSQPAAESRQGQERVLAGQSGGSPVDAERPTRSEGQVPDAARTLAGGHRGDQVVKKMKSVETQTYADDKTRAYADLPEQLTTEGTTGAGYGEPVVPVSRQGAFGTLGPQYHPPIQESSPQAMPLGNPPALTVVYERQQTHRKETSLERQGGEPGADDRQVPAGRQGGEPGADDRQVPGGRQGGEPGADDRQVPAGTNRGVDAETRPPEGAENVHTSVGTQTEINAERCRASVNLLLDHSGNDAQTIEHKEHIIHEMSQGSRQVFRVKTAHGLAVHVLKQQTWKTDKLWSSCTADSNVSEVGVHNVLKELDHHNKKIGHIVEYFSLEHSKRLDIIRLIQKIHDKCDFCETIYSSVT